MESTTIDLPKNYGFSGDILEIDSMTDLEAQRALTVRPRETSRLH
jgi:hypothetical protein